MKLIDSAGNETTNLADAVAMSFDGTSFTTSQDGIPTIDISAGGWKNGVSIDTQVGGGQWNTIDGGVNWLRAR